jgi:hypothetical protein
MDSQLHSPFKFTNIFKGTYNISHINGNISIVSTTTKLHNVLIFDQRLHMQRTQL